MKKNIDFEIKNYGAEMYELVKKLYPICRSITGDGVRKTLRIIKKHIPIETHEVASGTKAFDWTVPKEWNIKDAYIKDPRGIRIADFKKSNLHVLNYSVPINKKMALRELKKHIFTLPNFPDRVLYLTSYYKEKWGFCLPHNEYKKLKDGIYEVVIDSTLKPGHLTFAELHKKGRKEDEVLLSSYVCHPSLCNDNLSGIALLTFLAQQLLKYDTKYSYRFLFIPETIGSIAWLSLNENKLSKIKYGLVATCVGDAGSLTYKKARDDNAEINKIAEKALIDLNKPYNIMDFTPSGSDERQFCSPGFNLPVGSLMRTPYGRFNQYHTSADNLNFIKPEFLADSLNAYWHVISIIENDIKYLNLNPKCEPQLGKRNLYRTTSSKKATTRNEDELALFWVMNLSDGNHSLLDISIRSGIKFQKIKKAANALFSHKLLKPLHANI